MEQKVKFPGYKDHLNKSFLEELSYKIWSTKGARFTANKRLLTKNNLSNTAIVFLTAYLIIFGLLSVYQISGSNRILNDKIIAFGSTAISILLLVFSQLEASKDYKLRAYSFHDCALKLSDIYNKIRVFKTLKNTTEEEKLLFAQKTSEEYQNVLGHFSNHDTIDYKLFMAKNRGYYELNRATVFFIHINYYFQTSFLYHILIVIPIIVAMKYGSALNIF